MNGAKLRTRGRAALGALAIVLISASMPAGAGVIPDEVKFVDDYVDLYEEDNRVADEPGLGIGWAIARLDVADVALSNLVDRGELRANTGDIRTTVTTVGQPYSELMFNPHHMFNDVVPPWNPKRRGLDSDPEQGTYRAVLEHPSVPDVEGLLGIGRYYVQSNAKGSFAELGSASGWMRAKRFGLVSDMGDKGLVSAVTNEAAGAKVALTVEDFQINLNDVFQQEAVELPLGLTLDIATAVSLPGGQTAQKAYERLKEFEQELGVLNALAEDLAFLREELQPYAAVMPGYAEAEAAVEAAEAQLAAARAGAKAAAEEVVRLVAENEALNTAINSVNTMLAAVTQDIAMLQGHIDALNQQIADTVKTIKELEVQYEELKKLEEEASADGLLGIASTNRIRRSVWAKRATLRNGVRMRAAATSADLLGQLQQARERLSELTADLSDSSTGKAAMEAARNVLSDDLTDLTVDKDAHDEVLAAAQDASLDADSDVTEREVDLEEATAALEAITERAGEAGATVAVISERIQNKKVDIQGTVATVRDLAGDLAALVPIYQGLTETLEPWPMFKIHAISYELDTRIGYKGAEMKVRCGLEGVELLGEMLPLRTCDDLRGAKPMIEQELADFLALFTLERPDVELTVPSGIVDDRGVVNGQHKVRSVMTPLGLSISPFQLRTLTDPLMDTINARIDTLQEQASYDEIREVARLGEPPKRLTDWVLDWDRGKEWEAPSDRDQIEMASVRPARVQAASSEPRYGAASADPGDTEQDLDRELDGFQEDAGQTTGDEVGGKGTSGVDASVGGMETDVMWAGCVGCVDPPCQPGDPDCPDPGPCVQGSPDCPPPCVPGNPDCPINCRAGDPDCRDKCKPGAACTTDKVKGGKGTAGDAEGTDGGGANDTAGPGNGNGSDGYPLGDVVGDANLPHTGGRPATLLLGLVLLMAAGLMRRKPAASGDGVS